MMSRWTLGVVLLCFGTADASAAGAEKVNPHLSMVQDHKNVGPVCLLCHSVDPSFKPAVAGLPAFLSRPSKTLCETCHGDRPHVGAWEHLKPLSAAMLKRVEAWQADTKKTLPLGEGNEVLCVSCHNPHPAAALQAVDEKRYSGLADLGGGQYKGLREKSSLAPENAERIKELKLVSSAVELPFRARLEGGELCRICHEPE